MPRSRVKQNPLLTVDNKLLLQKHTQKYKIIGHTVDLFVINTAVTGKNSTFKNIVSRSFIQPYQSIKSVGTRERRKNILQLLSIIEEIAVPCIGLRKQSEERFTPVRYHCKATVIYNIRAFTVDFRVIAALKLCEITYKTALDLPTDIARRCKSEVRLGTLKQCDYPARNIRH